MRRRRIGVGRLVFTLAVAACGGSDGGTDPATPQVAHVTIAPSPDSLFVGQAIQLVATPTTSGGDPITGLPVTWEASNPAIATITPGGMLSGVAVGSVSIEATIAGHADTIVVLIKQVPVAFIVLNIGGDTLAPTQTVTLAATALDAAHQPLTGRPFTFTTGDAGVATVSAAGVVTAVGLGTVDITVSSGAASTSVPILVPQCSNGIQVAINSWSLPVRSGRTDPSGTLQASGSYKGHGALYGAGLVVGTSGTQTITAYEPASLANDFTSTPVCQLGVPAESHTYAKLSYPAGAGSPAGLRITQETFAYSDAPSAGFVLFRYSIANTTAATLPGVVAGWVADWDLDFDFSPGTDVGRRYSGTGASEALEPDSAAHPQMVGTVSIVSAGAFSYSGWTNGGEPTRAEYYTILASGLPSAATVTGDIRQVVGRAAFSLAAGQHRTLYFAIVGGDNRAQFNANVAAAMARANLLGFP